MIRRLVSLVSLSSVLARGGEAYAIEPTECASAYEKAQVLRRSAKFRAAREQLSICVQKGCPAFIVTDCAEWGRDLDDKAPTVIISAQDERGRDLTEVRVAVDGVPLLERLDGTAVAIDPGSHLFRLESDSAQTVENEYVVHAGERSRAIAVRMRARQPSQPSVEPAGPTAPALDRASDSAKAPDRTAVIVLGVAGIAGLAGFAYFGLTGRAQVADMRTECSPRCNPSDVDAATRNLHIADAALGLGVLSLGAATWLYLSKPRVHPSPSKATFEILPTVSGGTAEVAVTF
jgi:hypothetical protein